MLRELNELDLCPGLCDLEVVRGKSRPKRSQPHPTSSHSKAVAWPGLKMSSLSPDGDLRRLATLLESSPDFVFILLSVHSKLLPGASRQTAAFSALASAKGGLGCGQAGGCWV